MKKRILSIMLTACLVMGLMPTVAFASENAADILCEHHTEHTAECGYKAAIEGHECMHEHDDQCGYTEGQACIHEHDEECGYIEAFEGSPCTFVCDICEDEEELQENNLSEAALAVQDLIDTIPEAENITEDNFEDIADLLGEIDTLKEELITEEIEILDFTKYDNAVDKIMEFIGQAGTEEPALMATSNCTCLIKCKETNNGCTACASGIGSCAGRPKFVDYQGESIVNADGLHSIMSWPASQRDYYYYALDWEIRNDNDDLDVLAAVPSGADVVIDLNGKTLDGNNKGTIFEVAGKLTIIDTVGTGQIINASNGAFHILEGGSVILKGGTIRNCVGAGAITVESGGNLDMINVTMKNNKIVDLRGDYKDDSIKQYTRNITMKGNSVVSLGKNTNILCCDKDGCSCSGDSIHLSKTYDNGGTELVPTLYANYGEITGNVYNAGKFLYRNINYGSGTKIYGIVKNHGTIDASKGGGNGAKFYSTVTNNGTISGGHFHSTIENNGTISGGRFYDNATTTNNGTISGGMFNSVITNNKTGIISGGIFSFANDTTIINNDGTISGGEFTLLIVNHGIIIGGTFNRKVDNVGETTNDAGEITADAGVISGGTFNGYVENRGVISGGIFYGTVENSNGTIQDSAYVPVYFVTNINKVIDTVKVLRGQGVPSSDIPQFRPQQYGYDEFAGWHYEGDKFTGGGKFTANENYIYAELSKLITYDISYNLYGGTANNPATYNAETETFTLENPTKTGYDFAGWSGITLDGINNTTVTIEQGSTGDRVFKANYTAKSNWSGTSGSLYRPSKAPSKITNNTGTTAVGTIENSTAKTEAALRTINIAAENAAKADENISLVNAAGTTVSGGDFILPAVLSIPVDTNGIKDVNNLTLAKFNPETGKLEIVGGTYNAETKTISGFITEAGSYFVVEKKGLTSMTLQIGNNDVTLNNTGIKLDAPPIISQDRTLVPLRFIGESLGANVNWEDTTKTVGISLGEKELTMQIGKEIEGYGAAPVISNNRTLVPLRYVSEQLGANVLWVPSTNTISIVHWGD